MSKIIAYERVSKRDTAKEIGVEKFFETPEIILSLWEKIDSDKIINIYESIKSSDDKVYRNNLKRELLPAVSLFNAGIMTVDIDGLENRKGTKAKIIEILKQDDSIYCLQESVSGNLVIFYKFKCTVEDYPFLYYKIYLELTLKLGVEIDYLPDAGRLRYVSIGEKYIYNPDASPLFEILKVEKLPRFGAALTGAETRKAIFKSV